ncbi:hypothetical protein FA95DRAFT_784214 [Auriscalpium vulgare]|uniref:Uncharacterized protein n=1 Tax=Auriscalpium vulgare TaxID=40419 RepID=A0ACB8RAQ0_9AGAM|nr:hypothetical protein FA95DRAFT_784214 [Auriscalpium vulgare]
MADDILHGTDLTKALNLEDVSSLISTHHQAMISRNAHYTRSIPPGTRIGDFGYMSRGRHAAFHRLGNIFDDPAFHGEVLDDSELYLEILQTLDLETGHLFLIPGPDTVSSDGSACWRIFIPQPSAAEWMHLSLRLAKSVDEAEAVQFMSARGRSLAEQYGIEPEDLVYGMFDVEALWPRDTNLN